MHNPYKEDIDERVIIGGVCLCLLYWLCCVPAVLLCAAQVLVSRRLFIIIPLC